MIQCIDHVNIVVSDLTKTRDLFSLLGFTESDASQLSGDWISSITGLANVSAHYVRMEIEGTATRLELIEYESPLPGPAHLVIVSNSQSHYYINFTNLWTFITPSRILHRICCFHPQARHNFDRN
jgi:hypothetical protein